MALDVPAEFTLIVPQGYIAILRGFRWIISPTTQGQGIPLLDPNNFAARITVDGIVQPGYDALQRLGSNVIDFIPCYILADSGQILQLEFVPTGGNFGPFDIVAQLHGNILLKSRGLPLQFEPGSS